MITEGKKMADCLFAGDFDFALQTTTSALAAAGEAECSGAIWQTMHMLSMIHFFMTQISFVFDRL